ncbi:MAG: hypothetical protein NZ959_00865 [Armatimonadetes bacterium]|nr:hypothetical protein [Armatimonadota bacterium]MDW8121061.1 hypothetical protein [Armatimonadota bacterium]
MKRRRFLQKIGTQWAGLSASIIVGKGSLSPTPKEKRQQDLCGFIPLILATLVTEAVTSFI